ncbi:MAG TPA: choice-of-anchor D domain-containing protein, partial [Vulgatibacter sp.]
IKVEFDSLSFGKVPVGQTAELKVTIRSMRPAQLRVSSVVAEAKDGVSQKAYRVEPAGSFLVGGNQAKVISVFFSPSDVRNYPAELVVRSDDPDKPEERMALQGEGIEAAIKLVGCLPDDCAGTLVTAPAALDMGEVVAGQHQLIRVTIQNLGVDALDVSSIGFADEAVATAAGFSIDDRQRRPVAIARLSNQTLDVDFAPPLGSAGPVEARLKIVSSDRNQPVVELPLVAEVVPNKPPLACLVVRAIRSQSGTVREPGPGPVEIEPTETVILDADVRPGCTADPEEGKDVVTTWKLDGPDSYGKLATVPGAPLQRAFTAEVIGTYSVSVQAADSLGATSGVDENGVPATVVFDVVPKQDIAVEIRWPDAPGVDLDLHFVRGDVDKLWSDLDDCASLAACSSPQSPPAWGAAPPLTSPVLAIDDQGGKSLVETVLLNGPEAGRSYWIFAHYYEDRRPERASAIACDEEEPSCGGGTVCIDKKCMPPVEASVRIFLEGKEWLDDGLVSTRKLETPCDTWLVGAVIWRSTEEGPVVVQPADAMYPTGTPNKTVCARP